MLEDVEAAIVQAVVVSVQVLDDGHLGQVFRADLAVFNLRNCVNNSLSTISQKNNRITQIILGISPIHTHPTHHTLLSPSREKWSNLGVGVENVLGV